jgi:hypothetical protein
VCVYVKKSFLCDYHMVDSDLFSIIYVCNEFITNNNNRNDFTRPNERDKRDRQTSNKQFEISNSR